MKPELELSSYADDLQRSQVLMFVLGAEPPASGDEAVSLQD